MNKGKVCSVDSQIIYVITLWVSNMILILKWGQKHHFVLQGFHLCTFEGILLVFHMKQLILAKQNVLTYLNVTCYLVHKILATWILYFLYIVQHGWIHSLPGKNSYFTSCSIFLSVSFYFIFPLKDYQRLHPEVTVVDPPDAIQHLRNRQSMLEVVADLKLPESYGILWTTVLLSLYEMVSYDSICPFLALFLLFSRMGPYSSQ